MDGVGQAFDGVWACGLLGGRGRAGAEWQVSGLWRVGGPRRSLASFGGR